MRIDSRVSKLGGGAMWTFQHMCVSTHYWRQKKAQSLLLEQQINIGMVLKYSVLIRAAQCDVYVACAMK